MTKTVQALTDQEIDQLARKWYRALDVHVPVEELLPMLTPDGLTMVFPEATLHGIEEFKGWYKTVTNRFFDEVHEVKEVDSTLHGDHSDVKVVVNWQAKIWDPPEAKSKWLGFDAYQTWVVTRAASGEVVITKYVVDSLKPMEGSAAL
jgi:SnoaL-like domain